MVHVQVNNDQNILNIGKTFSTSPSGRYLSDGPGNGEDFRENYFWPAIEALKPGEKLEIILDDDVDGCGSSFLTEGFAGVVKNGYITSEELLNKITFTYTDSDFEFYKDRIIGYIKEASN